MYFDNLYGPTSKPKPTIKPQGKIFGDVFGKETKKITAITPKPVKKTTPITPTKPVSKPIKSKTLTESLFSTVQSIVSTAKREAGLFKEGFKTVKPRLQQSAGIIAGQVSRLANESTEYMKKDIEATKKQYPGIKIDPNAMKQRQKIIDVIDQKGKQLKDVSKKSFDKAELERFAKFGKKEGTVGFLEDLIYSSSSTVSSVGIGVIAGVVTKNPALAVYLGMGDVFTQGASEVYRDADKYGIKDEAQKERLALVGGVGYGFLAKFGLDRLINKSPAASILKRTFIQNLYRMTVSAGTQAGIEGANEGAEQLLANALAKTYNENRILWSGIPESVIGGAIMGSVTDVTLGTSLTVLGVSANKVDEALRTQPENRSEEQKKIVSMLLEKQMTPDEAMAMVIDKKLQKTEEGREIVKAVAVAKKENKNVIVRSSEDGQSISIDVVNPQVAEVAKKDAMDLKITPAKSLSESDRTIETQFSDRLSNDFESAVTEYNALPDTEGGRVLNTDSVRELNENYRMDRSKSAAVHEPASAFTKKLYEQKLEEVDPAGKNLVLFTAGGTGAGKSTAIKNIAEMKETYDSAQLVYDTNMSGYNSSVDKVEKALKAEKEVVIAYVYREPVDALNGALLRAERMGRTVPMSEHIKTHVQSLATVLKIAEVYKDNEHVDVQVIDNTKGKMKAVVSDLAFLQKISYNVDELRQKLTSALDQAYEQNTISEQVYKGFRSTESSQTSDSAGDRQEDSARNDEKPQQTDNAASKVESSTSKDVANESFYDTPKVLYRGVKKGYPNSGSVSGTWLTSDYKTAQKYAGEGGKVIEVDVTPELQAKFKDAGIKTEDGIKQYQARLGMNDALSELKNPRVAQESLPNQSFYDTNKNTPFDFNIEGLTREEYVKKHLKGLGEQRRGNKILLEIKYNELKRAEQSRIAQESISDAPITKNYDQSGKLIVENKRKKVLTGNEVKAIREVIEAKLSQLTTTASNAEQYKKGIKNIYDDILERSQGDKVVLSALRTELNKEMFGIAGASGNYREAYATLKTIQKNEPEIGEIIDIFEEYIIKLDDILTSTPDPEYQRPASIPRKTTQKQQGNVSANEPVGQGKVKKSTAYKKIAEARIAEQDRLSVTYNQVKQDDDFENAVNFVEKNPEAAIRVSLGLENAPAGIRYTSIAITTAEKAFSEDNIDLWNHIEAASSLRATRSGQEIVAYRGRFTNDSPHTYMKKLLSRRLFKLGGNVSDAVNQSLAKMGNVKEKAFAKIDKEVSRLQQKIKKDREKIGLAQDFIDKLRC